MKKDDEIVINTKKLVFGLDSMAKNDDNIVVFVDGALPDEKVKAKITSVNKSYIKAKAIEIIKQNEKRIKPQCPIYNACGSCKGQYSDYDYLIEKKSEILKEIFNNLTDSIYSVQKSPDIFEYRHKLQYPLRRTKNSKRLLIGYYKEKSHDLTNIKFCPMQPKIINEILDFIRNNCTTSCYDEKTKKGLLKNLLIRISNDDSKMLVTFVLNAKSQEIDRDLKDFLLKLKAQFSEIEGIFVNFNDKDNNTILGEVTHKIIGNDYIIDKLDNKKYKIGPLSFFQVNPKSAVLLFRKIKEKIKPNSTILDAFGGVGAIGIFLEGEKITLLEENADALFWAKENFELNNIKKYEILAGDANKNLEQLKKDKKKFDYIILDPPRKGVGNQGLDAIKDLSEKIIYVSCNPMSLKRDAKYLIQQGYSLKSVEGYDFFPYTHHIECLALFDKK